MSSVLIASPQGDPWGGRNHASTGPNPPTFDDVASATNKFRYPDGDDATSPGGNGGQGGGITGGGSHSVAGSHDLFIRAGDGGDGGDGADGANGSPDGLPGGKGGNGGAGGVSDVTVENGLGIAHGGDGGNGADGGDGGNGYVQPDSGLIPKGGKGGQAGAGGNGGNATIHVLGTGSGIAIGGLAGQSGQPGGGGTPGGGIGDPPPWVPIKGSALAL